ncbi:hypothetical protein FB451DRAFT_1169617 [Mycena latifolia]|nr:hypothetical protein FB451DRAFT_1169617 [Mycena latifolia]
MSSDTSDFSLRNRLSPDELKRQQHAKGQARYRERSQVPAVGNNLWVLSFWQDSREDARAGPRANEKRVSDRLSPDELKRQQHAEAQARYRERNLEKTRELARERMKKYQFSRLMPSQEVANTMSRHREKVALTSRATRVAAIKQRDIDADYRERQRKKKFIEKHGVSAFYKHYLPQHELQGKKHLPGLRFEDLDHPAPEAQKIRELRQKKGKEGQSARGKTGVVKKAATGA